jgi:hypothetical protein
MKKIKKWLRLLALTLLLVLALVGVGIAGVPVPPQNKKDEKIIEINVELNDEESDEAKLLDEMQKS